MIITHHREKLINAIIYFAKNTKYCGKIKIIKLLSELDFEHFKQTGKSATGLDYSAWDMGPVPAMLFKELSGTICPDLADAIKIVPAGELQQIIPKKKFNSKYFTKREKNLLSNFVEIFRDATAEQMKESSHRKDGPWDRTVKEKGINQPIDYYTALDDSKDSLTHDEAAERVREREEMYQAFGVQ
ncbi:MAG: SocA family protein [Bacteroidetes bacterium]|nr:SocA family protein [Bacteroidota bacterium]